MREINSGRFNGGEVIACYVSVEHCQGVAEPERAGYLQSHSGICGRIWRAGAEGMMQYRVAHLMMN
jgi:hypothetical protein